MNFQEAFDLAVSKTLEQGKKAKLGDHCAYRGDNGTKCAVGQLLTDEQIEKYDIDNGLPPAEFPKELIAEMFPEYDIDNLVVRESVVDFLQSLQDCHDDPPDDQFVEGFKNKARHIANVWGDTWNLKFKF